VTVSATPSKTFGQAWDRLTLAPIAHRGLWSQHGAPENSLGAFQHAAEQGYGVELDVRLSADGEAMVFHDEILARMTGAEGRVCDHSARALQALTLNGGDETIPTLAEALAVIGHHSLVLIECKTASG
jgi:glycerophosphoryl diester phosphodiesterase